MIPENGLARGIQSKSVRGFGVELPVRGMRGVWGQPPHKNGGFRAYKSLVIKQPCSVKHGNIFCRQERPAKRICCRFIII